MSWQPPRSGVPVDRPAVILCAADVAVDRDRPDRHHPHRVRAAVTYCARFAATRGMSVVVRAEPTVVPLVLAEARRFDGRAYVLVAPDTADPDVLATADWSSGAVVDARSGGELRTRLVATPAAVAAIVIGGDQDAVDDHGELRQQRPDLPIYPVGSTGSAAATILARRESVGRAIDRDVLSRCLSYPLVMQRIFDDLERTTVAAAE